MDLIATADYLEMLNRNSHQMLTCKKKSDWINYAAYQIGTQGQTAHAWITLKW